VMTLREDGDLVFMLTVMGPPTAKGRPRFARARGHAYTPASTRKAELALREAIRVACRRDRWEPARGQCVLEVGFELALTQAQQRKPHLPCPHVVKPDLDNLAKLVLDAANGLLWLDDSQVVRIIAAKSRSIAPRTTIRVIAQPVAEAPSAPAKRARKPASP